MQLRWSEVQEDALILADTKTGARKVVLNTLARRILERQPRGESPFVFLLRAIRRGRAASTARSGTGSGGRPASRTVVSTTCAIPWPVTR